MQPVRQSTREEADCADGLGALSSPLIGTALLESGRSFNLLYAVSAAVGTVNLAALLVVFRLQRVAEAKASDAVPAGIVTVLRRPIVHLFACWFLLLCVAAINLPLTVAASVCAYTIALHALIAQLSDSAHAYATLALTMQTGGYTSAWLQQERGAPTSAGCAPLPCRAH